MTITLREIMIEVSIKHQLTIEQIRSPSRLPKLVMARREFCYRALKETGRTPGEIGNFVRRDLHTVNWAAARYCRDNDLPPPRGKELYAKSYRWEDWRTWPYHRRRLEARANA